MTQVTVIGQGLNTHFATFTDLLPREGSEPVHVLLTNVSYVDDGEMNKILADKRALYPAGTLFYTSMHELSRFICNSTAKTIVVDNLNLYVSNVLLLNNSHMDLEDAIFHTISEDCRALTEALAGGHLDAENLYILTSEVDCDYTIRTEVGHLYQRLLYRMNGHIINATNAAYGILTNGAILWVRHSR